MSCNMERTTIVVVLIEPICKQLPKTVVVIRWKKPAFEKETVMTQKLARHRLYFQYSELPFRQKKTEKTDVHKIQPRTLFCKRYIIKKSWQKILSQDDFWTNFFCDDLISYAGNLFCLVWKKIPFHSLICIKDSNFLKNCWCLSSKGKQQQPTIIFCLLCGKDFLRRTVLLVFCVVTNSSLSNFWQR